MINICKYCGENFKTYRPESKFCGKDCYSGYKAGSGNPFFGKSHSESSKLKISSANSGKIRTDEYKKRRSEQYKGKGNPFWGKHHSQEAKKVILEKQKSHQMLFGNQFKNKKHSQETVTKLSLKAIKRIESGNLNTFRIGRKGKYKSFVYHSVYELARMKQLENDSSVERFEKNSSFKIPYFYNGRMKNYLPDFVIHRKDGSVEIEEVKGYEREIDIIKASSAKEFLGRKGISFRTLYKRDIFNSDYEYRKFLKENK